MLGKRIINATSGVACTTDTVQILDGVPFDSIATYELESDATNSMKSGYIGNAAIFNGSSSRIDASNVSNFPTGNSSRSISLWVYNKNTVTAGIIGYGNSANSQAFYLYLDGQGNLGVYGYYYNYDSNYTLPTNQWVHLVITHDGTTTKVYANGTEQFNLARTFNTGASSFRIGGVHWNNSGEYFNGKIDEVRIYNTALTQANVDALYAETASSTISISGLQAHYKLEGDATDEQGSYNGTATNVSYGYDGTDSNVTYPTGKFGNAGEFNGSSSNVTLPAGINKNNNFSWSFWVNFDSLTDYDTTIAFQNTYRNYLDILANGTLHFYDGVSLNSPTGTVTTGTWYHVVITKSSSTGRKMYLNNSVVASDSGTTNSISGGGQNMIGAYNSGSSTFYYLDAKIDQVRVYDKALSEANVATLYAETLATSQTNISLNTPSGVAYYKMNDATDETGSYDGTATNVNFNVAGKFGNAGEFNGSSSGINLPSSLNTNVIDATGAFSISMWINANDISTIQYLFCASTANNIDLGINTNNQGVGKIVWTIYNTSYSYLISTTTITTNTWYNIVVTYNNGLSELFINGASQGTITKTLVESSIEPTLGYRNTGGSVRFNGSIDQVRIFDRAITSDEVETLYDEVQCIPTIVPTDYFEPVIYTGGSQQVIPLAFEPDFLWIKSRGGAYSHLLFDSVRGIDLPNDYYLQSNTTAQQVTTTDRFSLNGNSITIPIGSNVINSSAGSPYIMWNWKAGGSAVSNTDGDNNSAMVSANPDTGFSIITYTGTGTNNSSVGHGLDSKPEMFIYKRFNSSGSWGIVHKDVNNYKAYLAFTSGTPTSDTNMNAPTDEVIRFNTTAPTYNGTSQNWLIYAFHSVDGYSKIGSYEGTGASNSIVTGFRPAFVMVKRTNGSGNWLMFDNKRGGTNEAMLRADTSDSEFSGNRIDFNSNGFTLVDNDGSRNASGGTYIYLAIAEENVQPEPELANSFNVVTYTGNGSTQAVTGLGFQPDLVWIKGRENVATTEHNRLTDSVRGALNTLTTDETGAALDRSGGVQSFDSDGFTVGNDGSFNYNGMDTVAWCWKASNDSTINNDGSISSVVSANPAAGFSVVKYTSTSSTSTIGHGLDDVPELIILKSTTNTGDWQVYSSVTGNTKKLLLNSTAAASTSGIWSNTSPTSSVFTSAFNSVGSVIAYAFHSVDGYQKVGSYSGSGGAGNKQTIGFKPKFLMVKLTNGGGSWWIFDSARTPNDPRNKTLRADTNDTDYTLDGVDFEIDGFSFNSLYFNESGSNFIYLAIA